MLVWVCTGATPSFAETPLNLRHAEFKPVTLTGSLTITANSLAGTVRDGEWIGYNTEPLPGTTICGSWHSNRASRARLERDDDDMSTVQYDEEDDGFRIKRDMIILLRVGDGEIDRIRLFTDDCDVDASGSTIHWLGSASTGESISLLSKYVEMTPSSKREREALQGRAVSAIAMHGDTSSALALERVLRVQKDDEVRGNIAFWIGNSDAPYSVAILRRLINDDPSAHVREQAIFALSQNDHPEAIDALIDAARNDDDPEIRSKALFWLAQIAGERATEALKDAAVEDPDVDVKEQAVFALSQLPEDEAIPALIEVARNNKSAKIRENAIFWLGQSDDPRALTFFEEILSR
jgi:hypothetical protein